MAYIQLTHPLGPIGTKLYNQSASAVGGAGPYAIDVVFTLDGVLDAVYTAGGPPYVVGDIGQYVNLAWRFFGPDGPPRVLSDDGSGVDGTFANPKSFDAPTPGRYLVRLAANVLELDGNGDVNPSPVVSEFAAFLEVEDVAVIGNVDGGHLEYDPGSTGTSFIAPTEKDEFDADEGWARSAERYFSTVSKQLGNRRMVTVKVSEEVFPGDVVTLTGGSYIRWKNSIIGTDVGGTEVYYYNFVLQARKLTIGEVQSDVVLEAPLFVVLQHAAQNERTSALAEGTLPSDTGAMGAANVDDRIYVSQASALTAVLPSSMDMNNRDRLIGHAVHIGAEDSSPPGSVFFHGTIPWLPGVVTGPLSSTDDAVVRWDGTTGDKIKDSRVILTQDDGTEDAEFRTSTDDWNVTVTTGDASGAPTASPGKVTISAGDRISGLGAKASVVGGRSHDAQGGPVAIQGGRGETEGGVAEVQGGGGWDVATGEGGDAKLIGGPGAGGDGGQVHISGGSADNGGTGGTVFIEGGFDLDTGLLNGIVRINEGANAICEIGNPAHTASYLLEVHKGIKATNQADTAVTVESTASYTKFSMLAVTSGSADSKNTILFGDDVNGAAGSIEYNMEPAAANGADKLIFSVWDTSSASSFAILTLNTVAVPQATIDGDLTVNGNGYFCNGKIRLYDNEFTGNSPVGGNCMVTDLVAYFDGDIDVTGNVDPTGVVFSQQDPATPPYDPTAGSADKGLLYTAEGSGGDPNTLRYIDNQGVEIIVGQTGIASPADVGGVISTDHAIASWNGDQGEALLNTHILIDTITDHNAGTLPGDYVSGPSISTDPNNSYDPDATSNFLTPPLVIKTADGILDDGGYMGSGDLHLQTGNAFNFLPADLAPAGNLRIHAGDGVGVGLYVEGEDDGTGGDVVLGAGGTKHLHQGGGFLNIAGGFHSGGRPQDAAGNVDPLEAEYGQGVAGGATIRGGNGNKGGGVIIAGGASVDFDKPGSPGIASGGDVLIAGGGGGLWEDDVNESITASIHGGAASPIAEPTTGGNVRVHAGGTADSFNNDDSGDHFLRKGGSGGDVEVYAGDAGYSTGYVEESDLEYDGIVIGQTAHGKGGNVDIHAGKGDHGSAGGSVDIRSAHTHEGRGAIDPDEGNQGQGAAGVVNIKGADTIDTDGSWNHRTSGGDVYITAGFAGTDSKASNMSHDVPNTPDLTGTAEANVVVAPGEPDWWYNGSPAGPEFAGIGDAWPTQGSGDSHPGELLQPWPSIVSLDPYHRGVTVIGADHFNGQSSDTDGSGVPLFPDSMMCNGRVPRLVVKGAAKITGGLDPKYVSFSSHTEHPMVTEMTEQYDPEELPERLAAHVGLRSLTVWIHEDWEGNGPTLMLGEQPIQGGGGGGGGNFLLGGGNMKHLGSYEGHSVDGHVVANNLDTVSRLTKDGAGRVQLTVTPTEPNSKMLLRYNGYVSFVDANHESGNNTTQLMFTRKNPSDGSWTRLAPGGGNWAAGSEPEWESDGGWNLRTECRASLIDLEAPVNQGSMQSTFYMDTRPPGLDPVLYEVWVHGDAGDGQTVYGKDSLPQTFEVIEVFVGDGIFEGDIPVFEDPPPEPGLNGMASASGGEDGGVVMRNDTTLEAVAAPHTSEEDYEFIGIRTIGAVFSRVDNVDDTTWTFGYWDGDGDGDGDFSANAYHAVGMSDHILSIDTRNLGGLDGGDGIFAIDLPTPSEEDKGRTLIIKDAFGRREAQIFIRAANENDPNESEAWSIEGQHEVIMNNTPFASVTIYCAGAVGYYVV